MLHLARSSTVQNSLFGVSLRQGRFMSSWAGRGRVGAFRASTAMNKPPSSSASSAQDNFVNGTSAVYVDQMFDAWRADPQSVHASWRSYFENVEAGVPQPFQAPPVASSGSSGVDLNAVLAAI
mmetsp:Transcript_10024/g.16849  ORF Transcript_10024/g.16849 Transcript_10024/m.16849 type:complete len:123 (+) Transcript_10024:72-440(+)